MQATWVQSLGQEDPLDKGTAPTPVFLPGEFHGQRTRWATVREIAQSRTPLCDRLPLFLSSGEKRNARSRGVWKSELVLTIPDPGGGSATGGNQAHFREEPPRAPPPPALVSSASITEGMVGRWGPLPSAPLVSRSTGHWPGVSGATKAQPSQVKRQIQRREGLGGPPPSPPQAHWHRCTHARRPQPRPDSPEASPSPPLPPRSVC